MFGGMDALVAIGGFLGGAAAIYVAIRSPTIERLRNELEIRKSRSGLLYERRLSTLVDLYGQLGTLEQAAVQVVKPMRWAGDEDIEDSWERFGQRMRKLEEDLPRLTILLPRELAETTQTLVQSIRKAMSDFAFQQRHDGQKGNWPDWPEIWERFRTEIPSLRRELEEQYRSLLEPHM